MALENYVKFLRGTPKAFQNLTTKDKDTLYFISETDSPTGVLYLGDKKITNDISTDVKLDDLSDVVVKDNIAKDSILA